MNKLNYGSFDITNSDIAFSSTSGYDEPQSELERRKQLSYPLKEVKTFVNNTVPVKGDNPVQLVVSNSNVLQYREEPTGILIDLKVGESGVVPSHTHGNISNGGDITTNATIASGDRLIINDESDSKIANSSITFGNSTETFLANNGTWVTPEFGIGVDTGNILYQSSSAGTYTLTEDAFVEMWGNPYSGIYIDGYMIAGDPAGSWAPNPMWFYLKKGQTIQFSNSAKVFGLK